MIFDTGQVLELFQLSDKGALVLFCYVRSKSEEDLTAHNVSYSL